MNARIKKLISVIIIFAVFVGVMNLNVIDVQASCKNNFSLVFDASYYAATYEDLRNIYGDNEALLLEHFVSFGMREGRRGSEDFDPIVYMNRYPELYAMYGDNLAKYYLHYITIGYEEGRSGRADGQVTVRRGQCNIKQYTNDEIVAFYDNAVFIGDSIMEGYRNYSVMDSEAICRKANFLTVRSYSLVHALTDASIDSFQPVYKGKRDNVWTAVKNMNADKVFILFGTNDLSVFTPDQVAANTWRLVKNIRTVNPGVEVYVISMAPVYKNVSNGYLNKAGVDELNTYLKNGQYMNMYTYVELNAALVDKNGNQKASYSSDSYVHYNTDGYSLGWDPVFTQLASKELSCK